MYNSLFFADILSHAIPDETYMGLSVIRVPDNCRTMCPVLQLCYPKLRPWLYDLDGLEEVIDTLQKYIMDEPKKALVKNLELRGWFKKEPLKLLSLGLRYDWKDATRIAANELLFLSPQELSALCTADTTGTIDEQALWDYHKRCGAFVEERLSALSHSHRVDFASPLKMIYICKTEAAGLMRIVHSKRVLLPKKLLGKICLSLPEKDIWCHDWLETLLTTMRERVGARPLGGVTLDDAIINMITPIAMAQCSTQTAVDVRCIMETIADWEQGVVRFQVPLVPTSNHSLRRRGI